MKKNDAGQPGAERGSRSSMQGRHTPRTLPGCRCDNNKCDLRESARSRSTTTAPSTRAVTACLCWARDVVLHVSHVGFSSWIIGDALSEVGSSVVRALEMLTGLPEGCLADRMSTSYHNWTILRNHNESQERAVLVY